MEKIEIMIPTDPCIAYGFYQGVKCALSLLEQNKALTFDRYGELIKDYLALIDSIKDAKADMKQARDIAYHISREWRLGR